MLIEPEPINAIIRLNMDNADQPALMAMRLLSFDEDEDEVDFIEQGHHQRKTALIDSSFCSTDPAPQRKNKVKPTKVPLQESLGHLTSEPSEHCVVFGRDKFAHKHPGNIFFRQLVSQLREEYQSTKVRRKKASITHQIINAITSKGGRFLKMNCSAENGGGWYQVGDTQVYEKVSHALRSAKPGCGKSSSSMMMKKASSFANSPAIVMPVETPVQEGNFHDLMKRQSQILSSLKSGSSSHAATQPSANHNYYAVDTRTPMMQPMHHPYPPYMPYHPYSYHK